MNTRGTDEEDHDKSISEYFYQSHFTLVSVLMRSELIINYSHLQMFPQAHSNNALLLADFDKRGDNQRHLFQTSPSVPNALDILGNRATASSFTIPARERT